MTADEIKKRCTCECPIDPSEDRRGDYNTCLVCGGEIGGDLSGCRVMCPRCGEPMVFSGKTGMCPSCEGSVRTELQEARARDGAVDDTPFDTPFGSNLYALIFPPPVCKLCGSEGERENPVLEWQTVLQHADGHPDLEILEAVYRKHAADGEPFRACLMCMVGQVYELGLMPPVPAGPLEE